MTWKSYLGFIFGRKRIRCLFALILLLLYLSMAYLRLILFRMINQDNTLQLSKQIQLGLMKTTKDGLHWIPDSSKLTVEADASKAKDIVSGQKTSRTKYIIALRYYEQLGRATENLLALCSLAKFGERFVVAPFVNNSRMAGIPFGVGHHLRTKRVVSFSPFSTYFDEQQVKDKLRSRGYSTLTSLDHMAKTCNRRLNIVVHFLYHERKSIEDAASWYRITEKDLENIYLQARLNKGWTNCPHVSKSKIGKQLGEFKISRYVCVDPEIIRTPMKFEEEVLQGANCVGIVQWKGVGPGRSHFSLSTTIATALRPSDLQHNAQLISLAKTFISNSGLGRSFIAVHVRAERHIIRRGRNITRQCFHKLSARVQKLRTKHKWNVYLASDIADHGSDTLIQNVGKEQRLALHFELNKLLQYPVTLSHIQGLHDTGAIAIIEMHILAAGKKLVTLGGGNYQEWVIQLFLRNARESKHSLHRVCELR